MKVGMRMSDDTISRKAAIDAILAVTGNSSVRELYEHVQEHELSDMWSGGVNAAIDIIIAVPSAQPEKRTEERTETHACDLISRQDAIDALDKRFDSIPMEQTTEILLLRKDLRALPSAQPEPCVDTIDALDESIKHFDDMAEECRRNANIEQNDYMDMRDDAAEYRQLSIWLNELKWLRERFQSQPDLSEYSDKLWKRAYERGKAEALDEIVRCKDCKQFRRWIDTDICFCDITEAEMSDNDFCSKAERKTDED